MNNIFGVLFALHAFAHLAGFIGAFRLVATVPHQTSLLMGRLQASEPATRAAGVIWLGIAILFAVAAGAAFAAAPWWPRYVVIASLSSLVMCVLFLPETRIGLFVNLALLAVFVFGRAAFWWVVRD